MNYRVKFLILVLVCVVAASTMACGLCSIPVRIVEKGKSGDGNFLLRDDYVFSTPREKPAEEKLQEKIAVCLQVVEVLPIGLGLFLHLKKKKDEYDAGRAFGGVIGLMFFNVFGCIGLLLLFLFNLFVAGKLVPFFLPA